MPNDEFPNPELICPHCQIKGSVFTESIVRKVGVSGSKAVWAFLTGGISLLFIGLAQEADVTEAYCDNCSSTWHF